MKLRERRAVVKSRFLTLMHVVLDKLLCVMLKVVFDYQSDFSGLGIFYSIKLL